MAIQQFSLTLQQATTIAPDVLHFSFTRTDGGCIEFIPGQFITLLIQNDEKTLRRSYSIASVPEQRHCIEFSASYFTGGAASELLFNLKPGAQLNATGPHGRLILRDEQPKRIILVATGTGVTPYRSMLPSLAKRMADDQLQVVLVLGVKNREYCLFYDEFTQFAKAHPRFQFRAQYSRQTTDLTPGIEFAGRAQRAFSELDLKPNDDIIYLCGNPDMIDESFEYLKTKGFDASQVRREKYISSN